MKIDFYKFRHLFLESLLSEDKSRLIDRLVLPDIEDEIQKQKARDEMKVFFRQYSNWENKLDWNRLSEITYKDFEQIKQQATTTRRAQKREIDNDIKNIFKTSGAKKFERVGENDNWLFVAPLSYQAAMYCDSSENQGAGAKWCIGYEKNPGYWNDYIEHGSRFIMAFNKNYKSMSKLQLQVNLKFMIEKNSDGELTVWTQSDIDNEFNGRKFGITQAQLNEMFSKLEPIFKKMEEDAQQEMIDEFNAKIENLKNITVLKSDYFTPHEQVYLLKHLELPDNITKIAENAFTNSCLESIIIPDSVTKIGDRAFSHCRQLKSIRLPKYLKKIGVAVFDHTALESIEFPPNIKLIDYWAFYCCKNLREIVLPEGLRTIEFKAFGTLTPLQSFKTLVVPKSVKNIEPAAFEGNDYSTILFKGRTIEQVRAIDNYPWNVKEHAIEAEL